MAKAPPSRCLGQPECGRGRRLSGLSAPTHPGGDRSPTRPIPDDVQDRRRRDGDFGRLLSGDAVVPVDRRSNDPHPPPFHRDVAPIPARSSRPQRISRVQLIVHKAVQRMREWVERLVGPLKPYRRSATRSEKPAMKYPTTPTLGMTRLRLTCFSRDALLARTRRTVALPAADRLTGTSAWAPSPAGRFGDARARHFPVGPHQTAYPARRYPSRPARAASPSDHRPNRERHFESPPHRRDRLPIPDAPRHPADLRTE